MIVIISPYIANHESAHTLANTLADKYGSDYTYSQQVLNVINKYFGKKIEGEKVEKSMKSGTMKLDIQFFAEKDIERQKSSSLRHAIREFEKKIEEHKNYIEHPETHCPDWDNKLKREQDGLKRHWQKEINNFNQSIQNRIEELKKRGEYDD